MVNPKDADLIRDFLEYIENNSLPCIDKIINKNKG